MSKSESQNSSPGTRDRLIAAMLHALSTRGLHGVGLNELLAEAKAPKGVLYHHFPGGKTELAVAAIDYVVLRITQRLTFLFNRHGDLAHALDAWLTDAQKMLHVSGYEAGCPLATVALESTSEDKAIREAIAKGFDAIRDTLKDALTTNGLDLERADSLASLIISAYEGGLIQARVAESKKPFQDTVKMLLNVLQVSISKNPP